MPRHPSKSSPSKKAARPSSSVNPPLPIRPAQPPRRQWLIFTAGYAPHVETGTTAVDALRRAMRDQGFGPAAVTAIIESPSLVMVDGHAAGERPFFTALLSHKPQLGDIRLRCTQPAPVMQAAAATGRKR